MVLPAQPGRIRWRVNRNNIPLAFLSLLIYCILLFGFELIIAPNFFIPGLGEEGPYRFLTGHILATAVVLFMMLTRMSGFTYAILSCMTVMLLFPALIIHQHTSGDWRIVFSQMLFFFSVYFFLEWVPIKIKGPVVNDRQRTAFLLITSLIIIVPFIVLFLPYVNLNNLLLVDVYESRELEKSLSNPFTAYTYSWLGKVILPVLLVVSLMRKEYVKSAIAFACLIIMFLVGAHKSVFLGLFLVLAFMPGGYRQKVYYFYFGILLACALSMYLFFEKDNIVMASLFIRRVLFIPSILDTAYFGFFDGHHLFWSHSFMSSFIAYPFDLPPQNIMGEMVFRSVGVNANNGIISDGFMNLGMTGVVLNILLASTILSLFKHMNMDVRLFGIVFLFLFSLVSSYLPIVMVTHGGLLLLLVAQFLLRDNSSLRHSSWKPV